MQVKLEKTVPVPASVDVAWQVLQDIREVASCLPGAEVTEQVDPTHYKGRLRVKRVFDCQLIRLQCYEGLDANSAVYEWNYQRQLLAIKIEESEGHSAAEKERHIFSEGFLLRRRCLYHYLDYPSPDRELRIVKTHLPEISERLAGQVVELVRELRRQDLCKRPGIAETLDWATALLRLEISALDQAGDQAVERVRDTLACLVKTREDQVAMTPEVTARLVARATG
jgi:MoxR-like ATPase